MAQATKMTAKYIIYLISSVVIFGSLIFFGFRYYKKTESDKLNSAVEIGYRYKITEEEVQYQMAVNLITIPEPTDRALALKQLREMHSYQVIMERYGWPIRSQDLLSERQRIQRDTRAPEMLKKVIELPGFRPELFTEIFVRSTLLRRLIFSDFYFSKKELHRKTQNLTQKFAEEIQKKSTAEIKKIAWQQKGSVFTYSVSDKKGIQFVHMKPPSEINPDAIDPKPPLAKLFLRSDPLQNKILGWFLKLNEAPKFGNARIVDEGERFAVYVADTFDFKNRTSTGLMISFSKENFQTWINEELKSMKLSGPGI